MLRLVIFPLSTLVVWSILRTFLTFSPTLYKNSLLFNTNMREFIQVVRLHIRDENLHPFVNCDIVIPSQLRPLNESMIIFITVGNFDHILPSNN